MHIRKAEKTDLNQLQILGALLDSYRSVHFADNTKKFHTRTRVELSRKFYLNAGMIPATVEFWKEL